MVKKGMVYAILLVLLFIPLISGINESLVDEGYDCLNERVSQRTCEDLSLEEKVFSSLAIGKCTEEILDEAESDSCWSGDYPDCKLDLTAKVALALDKSGESYEDSVDWLSSQNKTTENLDWFLQVETSEKPANCDVSYNGNSYEASIDEEGDFTSDVGTCLGVSEEGNWLEISNDCYGMDIDVSCNSSFSTNLLFSGESSPAINVLEETSSASQGGTTTERVESLCLQEEDRCSYPGTLWGTLVLNYFGEDTSGYMPYLIASKEDEKRYLPDSFLYSLTDNRLYLEELLQIRSPAGYWEESGDRFYDTAIAMNSLRNSEISELEKTEEWLIDTQEDDGCWDNGNIRNTAFVLYSTWPKSFSDSETESETICSDEGYCLSRSKCDEAGGEELQEYTHTCSGTEVCCDSEEKEEETCEELAGEQESEICDEYNGEYCSEGEEISSASDLGYGEICCIGGSCEAEEEPDEPEEADCEENGGECRAGDCEENEYEETSRTCEGDDICCMSSGETSSDSEIPWWVWVLAVLVLLAALGIIFKDKLEELWVRMKSGSGNGKGKPGPRGPGGRPPAHPPGKPVPRRVAPRQQPQPRQRPRRHNPKELDSVLGKLREMGQ